MREEVDGALTLVVVGKRLHDQRVAVEDHLAPTEMSAKPVNPGTGCSIGTTRAARSGGRHSGRTRSVADVVVDANQVAVLAFAGPMVEQVGHHEAQLHVARRLAHPPSARR